MTNDNYVAAEGAAPQVTLENVTIGGETFENGKYVVGPTGKLQKDDKPLTTEDLKGVTRLDEPAFEGLYALKAEVAGLLKTMAKQACVLCKGTGVARYRLGGRSANPCKCTR